MFAFIRFSAATAAATAALALATASHAQFATESDAPIDIGADSADTRNNVTILEGQVDVRQADVRILADRMQIFSRGEGDLTDGITRIVAEGNFYYITPEQELKGDRGVYTAANDSFEVTGNVILLQDENVVTGERLIYNLTTRDAQVLGTCTGRACDRRERVRIIIRQQDQDAPGQAPS